MCCAKDFEFPPEAVGSYHRILKKESDIDRFAL